MTARRVYAVTVETTLYVVATSAMEAELWAEYNHREEDARPSVCATHVKRVPPGVATSLPWYADGADAGDEAKTVGDWIKDGAR